VWWVERSWKILPKIAQLLPKGSLSIAPNPLKPLQMPQQLHSTPADDPHIDGKLEFFRALHMVETQSSAHSSRAACDTKAKIFQLYGSFEDNDHFTDFRRDTRLMLDRQLGSYCCVEDFVRFARQKNIQMTPQLYSFFMDVAMMHPVI